MEVGKQQTRKKGSVEIVFLVVEVGAARYDVARRESELVVLVEFGASQHEAAE